MDDAERRKLEGIVQQVLNLETPPGPEESLKQRGLDSLALFTLIERLEESFAVKIEEDEVLPRHFDSVQGLVSYLDGKLR
ncbi:MAG: hypothetical protein GF355_11130 [Candidatus Eisenbacteria bacterium]|nr:hypothetical protein [Candidatus Eisenbacteria bacterium]